MMEKSFGFVLLIANPYIYALLKYGLYNHRGYEAIGGEVIIPIVIFVFALNLLGVFDKTKKGRRQHAK